MEPKNEKPSYNSYNDASKATPFFANMSEKNNNPLLKNENIQTTAFEPPTKHSAFNRAPDPSKNPYFYCDTPSKKLMELQKNQQKINVKLSEKNNNFSNNSSSAFKKYGYFYLNF